MKVTPEKFIAFCSVLAETCQVRKACTATDISIQTAYRWRKEFPQFAEMWDEALKAATLGLESEVHRRAFEGVDEPVYQMGRQVGTVRKYSDTLAIFLLKSHAPEKYRDNHKVELSGSLALQTMSDADIVAELAKLGVAVPGVENTIGSATSGAGKNADPDDDGHSD